MLTATHSTCNKTIEMKSLFFLTVLFCATASAKAQLPPVRTSDPSGIQTEKANTTTVPLRKADNLSNTSNLSARTIAGTSTASKVPLRSTGPEATTVVEEKVPLRSTDPAANAAGGAQEKADASRKLLFPSQRAAGDSTKTSM